MRILTEREYLIKARFRAVIKALGGYEAASLAIRSLVKWQTLHAYGSIEHPDSFPRADVIMRLEDEYRVGRPISAVLYEGDGNEPAPIDMTHNGPLEMGARIGELLGGFHKTALDAAKDGDLDAGERHALIKRAESILIEATHIHDELHRYDISCRSNLQAVGE